MNLHDFHRGYGLKNQSIDADMANLLVKQGGALILDAKLDSYYGGLCRTVVEVPFRGSMSPADEYARVYIKTGKKDEQSVVLVLANHHEKPFIQITSDRKNATFAKDVELIKQIFGAPIDFKPHKFEKTLRNSHQQYSNELLDSFTSAVNWSGQPTIPNHCLIADVDRSVFNTFDYNKIKENTSIQSLAIGKGVDFEDPWQHEYLLSDFNLYLTVEPVKEIQTEGNKSTLSVIVGSGMFFDEQNRSRVVNKLQTKLLGLLEEYRVNDTAVAFGRKPMGTSIPYFMGPNTDMKKMINEIIENSSDHDVKGTLDDDTEVISHMYRGLIRGDDVSRKYAAQLRQVAREIYADLPKGMLKTYLSRTISNMNKTRISNIFN